eukprot:TRINITY_DN39488_c0_g1_i1.p2 TRINITY_DN39488_c0_g1~~TRINITY_DN39488_c0_g1_i1.p2  ORF type:complete len:231 (+),score=31.50 TRINITY_DN39488_c0_g1_i1:39-731(+)
MRANRQVIGSAAVVIAIAALASLLASTPAREPRHDVTAGSGCGGGQCLAPARPTEDDPDVLFERARDALLRSALTDHSALDGLRQLRRAAELSAARAWSSAPPPAVREVPCRRPAGAAANTSAGMGLYGDSLMSLMLEPGRRCLVGLDFLPGACGAVCSRMRSMRLRRLRRLRIWSPLPTACSMPPRVRGRCLLRRWSLKSARQTCDSPGSSGYPAGTCSSCTCSSGCVA